MKNSPIYRADADIVFTPIDQALSELRNRWSDINLHSRVREYLGVIPEYIRGSPKSVLGRFIATPNYELKKFLIFSKQTHLTPVVMELHNDKFCTRNPDKLNLVRMPVLKGINKYGNLLYRYYDACDCNEYQGMRFCDLLTYNDESLIHFHHRLLKSYISHPQFPMIYNDPFHAECLGKPKKFYFNFLARFICHGILFENISTKDELVFFEAVMLPVFNYVYEYFGVRPLIVKLLPDKNANDIFWRCYPKDVLEYIEKKSEFIPSILKLKKVAI